MWPFKKVKPLIIKMRKNQKPDYADYKIVKGEDLKVGDIIVYQCDRLVIVSCSQGLGAGDTDFGEYISIEAEKLSGPVGFLSIDFLTFKNCPMVLEVDE